MTIFIFKSQKRATACHGRTLPERTQTQTSRKDVDEQGPHSSFPRNPPWRAAPILPGPCGACFTYLEVTRTTYCYGYGYPHFSFGGTGSERSNACPKSRGGYVSDGVGVSPGGRTEQTGSFFFARAMLGTQPSLLRSCDPQCPSPAGGWGGGIPLSRVVGWFLPSCQIAGGSGADGSNPPVSLLLDRDSSAQRFGEPIPF